LGGVTRVAPSNTADGESLCFRSHDEQGTAFPMTSGSDAGQLIAHGSHCLQMVEMYSEAGSFPTNIVDQMHFDHCLCLGTRMYRYLEAFQGHYGIPEFLCKDIRSVQVDFHLNGGGVDNYYVEYRYGNYLVNESDSVTAAEQARFVYGALENLASKQAEVFGIISGHNLGSVLLADYLKEPLSPSEQRVIDRWNAEEVVRLGAFGVTCLGVGRDMRARGHMHGGADSDIYMAPGQLGGAVDHGHVHTPIALIKAILDKAPAPFKREYCLA